MWGPHSPHTHCKKEKAKKGPSPSAFAFMGYSRTYGDAAILFDSLHVVAPPPRDHIKRHETWHHDISSYSTLICSLLLAFFSLFSFPTRTGLQVLTNIAHLRAPTKKFLSFSFLVGGGGKMGEEEEEEASLQADSDGMLARGYVNFPE